MPRTAAQLRTAVIREITIAPGWNKEDATALVDELILSLPYSEDPVRKRAIEAEARAAALDEVRAAVERATSWPRVSWFAYEAQIRGEPFNPTEDRVVIDRADILAAIDALREKP